TLPDFLRVCREIGFDGVELTAYYFPTTGRGFLNEIKQRAHREGLAISGTAIGTDFAQPDADKRREHVAMAKAWIDHSVALGAPTMRVFAGAVREGESPEQTFQNVVECLRECAEYAHERGVLLALENHGGLTATADGTLRLLQAVAHPALGLNLDFGNFSGDIYGQFAACAPYAVATHAKPRSEGQVRGERVTVDYARVRQIMEAVGYRGFLAIEYEEEEPAETGVPRFAAELRAALRD
ncbi:MAG TPA: sugar phosphate isomerase/epimerase family protein, partial [Chthonomonadaceae bacterium]|nr:sugar phosphate isomerase/epimerase family protein [Chthonomonadaceae bacterium]